MTRSNYEVAKHDAARLFCQTDHTALAKRFGLVEASGFLNLTFFQQPFRLSLETGLVERLIGDVWTEVGFNEAMTIYDLLGYAQPTCHANGNMMNTKSLSAKMSAPSAPSTSSFYKRQEALFQECASGLQGALESLGGQPLGKADASAQFNVVDDLAMQVHFWCADEDFPPSLELFWDENVLQYMHYETVWYANGFIISEIEKRLNPFGRAEQR